MTSIYVLIYLGTILCLGRVCAQTEDGFKSFRAYVKPLYEECAKEMDLDFKIEIEKVMNKEFNKCFLACILRKSGILKNGMIDEQEYVNKLSTFIMNADKLEKYILLVKQCVLSANEQDVTDGDEGCERSGFLHVCLHEQLRENGLLALPK